ncbi:hypothetical protein [Erwinia pyrifoliae]|uniref:hypothetical protein n=1 Tax=Erwinia pyrifoliae TaxID=79967 RepID=UPI0021FF3DB6|nr:hypothetical protein [Erwinia pyrifoliae]UWS30142.1 hypothetical protein NYP81_01130 [Erwinia pyrifoliae]
MNVNFNSWEIFKVHLTSITGGNISTKTFNGLLDKLKSVENIPPPIENALCQKVKKHADLEIPLLTAYNKRDDKINTAELAKQQEILKNSKMSREEYAKKAYSISRKVVDASGGFFRCFVADDLESHNMDHESINETLTELKDTYDKVKEQEARLNELKATIQEETRSFTPKDENKRTGYIHNHHGYALEGYNNEIGKYKTEAEAIKRKLTIQREIYTKAVIDQSNIKPGFINPTMQSHLTDLTNLIEYHKALPKIQMRVQSKIDELTKRIGENKAKDNEIMEAKDQVIKHPDAPTHKTKSTLTDKIKNTPAAG